MNTVCPKCKGDQFTTSGPVEATGPIDYPHVKCNGCGTVLWVSTQNKYSEHGYCGNPTAHWTRPLTELEKVQRKAKEKTKVVESDIPF